MITRKQSSAEKLSVKHFSKDRLSLLLMAVPAMLCLIVFAYGPIYGWVYALFNYRIGARLADCNFVGLKYFKIALDDPNLINVLINTLALSFLSLLTIPVSALFAILLSELKFKRFGKLIQTATTLPNFMSWIIVFSVFSLFLSPGDGIVNNFLMKNHLIQTPLNPLGDVDFTWIFQTLIRMWKELGYQSIIFFAAIAGIDSELYDAAAVDGAGKFKQIQHVTIPGLIPTLVVILLINVGFLLSNGFDQTYVFFNGLVAPKLNVLDYYVYKLGLQNDDIPYATAISISKTFISVILVFAANKFAKKVQGHSII